MTRFTPSSNYILDSLTYLNEFYYIGKPISDDNTIGNILLDSESISIFDYDGNLYMTIDNSDEELFYSLEG